MARPSKYSVPPRDMALALLREHAAPMTAYALLAALKKQGVKSPPIIYRALAELQKQGLVHKIASIGAYVACNCGTRHDHPLSVLTICHDCQRVQELHDHAVMHHLGQLRAMAVALPPQAVIELPVLCGQCQAS